MCWLFLVRKVYGYLEDDNKVMTRPYLLMLYEISPSSNLLYAEMLVENLGKFPGAKRVQKILEDTIKTPNEDKNNLLTDQKALFSLLKNCSKI